VSGALLHAPLGDTHGNLHLEQPYVLDERFAGAARAVVATVDRLATPEEVAAAGITVPGHQVAAVAEVPFGAHPSSCYPGYASDRPMLADYTAAAQAGGERLVGWLDQWVTGTPSEEVCRKQVGEERLARLGSYRESVAAWEELFG
jgi:glutaconate CoA-transferase, subunit A